MGKSEKFSNIFSNKSGEKVSGEIVERKIWTGNYWIRCSQSGGKYLIAGAGARLGGGDRREED